MSRMRLIAWSGGSLKNGGSPSTISITMMPRDQISTYNYFNNRLLTELCSRFIVTATGNIFSCKIHKITITRMEF